MTEAERERYADPRAFAREVNLPLLGEVSVPSLPAGTPLPDLLRSPVPSSVAPIVESLTQTRQSLTLRSLLLAGFSHDPELFAIGLAVAREWSRRGLRVALVDLDFWSPTIVRPAAEGSEGLVDMLEFGCSFRRVAWEVVADRLWLLGPGSYLPEAERIAGHPDWERAARVMGTQVDVALFVAPLLERGAFLARLSKRMDGVLLAGSVERVPRTRLRDAFLELWGSDAPMIGCIGILPERAVAGAPPAAAPSPPAVGLPEIPLPMPDEEVHAPAAAAALAAAESFARAVDSARTPARGARAARGEESDLVARIEEEARRDMPPAALPGRSHRMRNWIVAAVVVIGAGSAALYAWGPSGPARRSAAFQETQPTGIERVLPAELGPAAEPGLSQAPSPGPEAGPAAPAPKPAPPAAGSGAAAQGTPAQGTPAPSAAAPSAPAPTGGANPSALPFRVHVASFRTETTVKRLAAELAARGLTAWYEAAPDRPGWFRVFVGHFATHAEAEAEAQRLLHRGLVQRAKAFPDEER